MDPHDVEVERALLSCVLCNPLSVTELHPVGLVPSDFYVPSHQAIFTAIQALYSKDAPIDLITLTNYLRDHDLLENIGIETLTQLLESYSATDSIVYYATIVKEKSLLRSVIDVCSETAQEASLVVEDIPLFLDRIEQRIFNIAENKVSETLKSLKSIVTENIAEVLENSKIKSRLDSYHSKSILTA